MSFDSINQCVAIKIEGLGKKYLIGHNVKGGRSKTFREALTNGLRGALASVKNMAQLKQLVSGDEIEEFWALRDINLEIRKGDAVGIIGRNGAGKSTLLKVLSRITEPTTGRIVITGRIASLLEVGTGFHPELTGRENIFLNGAILGMSRQEISGKIDRIIDFAGVEKFIDTPVKRYSSGMYVRLAFSVAAHLEPEILIVDEVLAVGDASFQKKCHNLMREFANSGKTVLFVSHNLRSLRELCRTGILLDQGQVEATGSLEAILEVYKESAEKSGQAQLGPILAELNVPEQKGDTTEFNLRLSSKNTASVSELCLIVTARSEERVYIINLQDHVDLPCDVAMEGLHFTIEQISPRLVEGSYDLGLYAKIDGKSFEDLAVARLDILPAQKSNGNYYSAKARGLVECEFKVRCVSHNLLNRCI